MTDEMPTRSNFAAAGFTSGVMGLLLSFIPLLIWISLLLCLTGIGLSLVAIRTKGQGIFGMILGVLGVIVSLTIRVF